MNVSEEAWLAWKSDPADLVRFLKPRTSSRKVRLFYCACVRQVWGKLNDPRSRRAAEQSERFADGKVDQDELLQAKRDGYEAWYDVASRSLHSHEDRAAAAAFMCANLDVESAYGVLCSAAFASGNESATYVSQVALLHDIVGDPFRPVAFEPAWRTVAAVGLALKMYDDRNFDAMPILADALEEAGCGVAAVLDHCREPGPHARGCWVADSVLGKR